MKIELMKMMGLAVVVGAMALVGCDKVCCTEPVKTPGAGERAGAALDRAVAKTVEVTTNAAANTVEATKSAAATTKEVTGQVLEKAGAAVEKAGVNLQK